MIVEVGIMSGCVHASAHTRLAIRIAHDTRGNHNTQEALHIQVKSCQRTDCITIRHAKRFLNSLV